MTPTPVPSTPTPGAWSTLTPYPTVNATAPIDLGGMEYTIAERVVQSYQTAQAYPLMDMLSWAIIMFLIVAGIWSIVRRLQRM